jgi:hypothetical protein
LGLKSAAAQEKPAQALPSILALDPSEKVWSLQVTAKSHVVVQKGDILVNSTHERALWTANSTLEAQDGSIKVVGGVSKLGQVTITPEPLTGAAPLADPIPAFRVPPPALISDKKLFLHDEEVTLQPGIYTDGIFSGGQRHIKLEPGVYVMNGGDFFLSDATVTGEGVTIVLAGANPGAFWTAAGTKVNLTPPSEGPLKGIVVLSRANGWNKIQLDDTEGNLKGLIYAPGAGAAFSHRCKVTLDRIICANLSAVGETDLTVTGDPVELAAPAEPKP